MSKAIHRSVSGLLLLGVCGVSFPKPALAFGGKKISSESAIELSYRVKDLSSEIHQLHVQAADQRKKGLAEAAGVKEIALISAERCQGISAEDATAHFLKLVSCYEERLEQKTTLHPLSRAYLESSIVQLRKLKGQNIRPTFSHYIVQEGEAPSGGRLPRPDRFSSLRIDHSNKEVIDYRSIKSCAEFNSKYPNTYVTAYCRSGCLAPETLIQTGATSRLMAGDIHRFLLSARTVMALASDATLERPLFESAEVSDWLSSRSTKSPSGSDRKPQEIVRITTASGTVLGVTPAHGMLRADGWVLQASALKVGDQLLRVDGTIDPISEIRNETRYVQVHNLDLVLASPKNNFISANGILVGTNLFQEGPAGKAALNSYLFQRAMNRAELGAVTPVTTSAKK